ncbi:hypothetical protein DPMN_086882 [Dreissena polymorpha]|uniref:Uncharacterized protein n=1 Tax=Dreissena polymorpha TaxID=45954 RepID=A0A9D4KRZ2_DREPO|nr:hypothetical protein DPMN_086882 [Dreissena polymorpha]
MFAVRKPVDILPHVNHGRYGKISHNIMMDSAAYGREAVQCKGVIAKCRTPWTPRAFTSRHNLRMSRIISRGWHLEVISFPPRTTVTTSGSHLNILSSNS